jgi:hypothetical protein
MALQDVRSRDKPIELGTKLFFSTFSLRFLLAQCLIPTLSYSSQNLSLGYYSCVSRLNVHISRQICESSFRPLVFMDDIKGMLCFSWYAILLARRKATAHRGIYDRKQMLHFLRCDMF